MAAVGYDLYCKMLNEAVSRLKGEKEEADYNTTIDLNIDAFIPESYIKNEYQKLDIYKRIAAIETEEEMDDMTEELIDRFGDIPKKVQQLLHIAALKSLAHSAYITAIEQKGKDYKFVLYEKANLDPAKIPAFLKKYGNNMTFKAEAVPYFLYQKKGRSGKEKGENVLQMLREIVELETIRTLVDAGEIVIAAGGGGIPVMEQGVALNGASAIIEKDLTSGLLAQELNADTLLILTSVEKVSLNLGQDNEEYLNTISVDDAKKYMADNQFAPGSMLPKFEAGISFIEKGDNRRTIITDIAHAKDGYFEKTGTIIK